MMKAGCIPDLLELASVGGFIDTIAFQGGYRLSRHLDLENM